MTKFHSLFATFAKISWIVSGSLTIGANHATPVSIYSKIMAS